VTLYLATSSSEGIQAAVDDGRLGRLCTPQGGSPPVTGAWAADSGCFTLGDRFDLDRYLRWLERMRPYVDRCRFAPAPDVVGDHDATVARSLPVLPAIRALGYPAAFVAQDGAQPETIPWDAFDVLFVGGSTEWKLGVDAWLICHEAQERGVPIHVGRVNSAKRYRFARDVLGAATVDGTYLSFGPNVNLPKLLAWR
jgi:hypothetical protein